MTVEEALWFFNTLLEINNMLKLLKDFNAEELKQSYRKLSHIYHPDEKGGDKTVFLSLNAAYECLKNKFSEMESSKEDTSEKESSKEYTSKNLELNKIRYTYRNKISDLIEWPHDETLNEESKIFLDKCQFLETMVRFAKKKISIESSEEEIKKIYENVLGNFKFVYTEIKNDFFSRYNILEELIEKEINYQVNIHAFYKSLLYLKEKYFIPSQIEMIEMIVKEYKEKESYPALKEEINNLIEECKKGFTLNLDLEIILNNIRQGIKSLFVQHENKKRLLSNLIKKTNKKEIHEKIKTLQNQLNEMSVKELTEQESLLISEIQKNIDAVELYVKVDEFSNEQELGTIYLATQFNEFGGNLLRWNPEYSNLSTTEVTTEDLLTNFDLLDYHINETHKMLAQKNRWDLCDFYGGHFSLDNPYCTAYELYGDPNETLGIEETKGHIAYRIMEDLKRVRKRSKSR